MIKPTEWADLPKEKQKHGAYWAAINKKEGEGFDGWEYEIVYIYYDGKWSVKTMCHGVLKLEDFLYLWQIETAPYLEGIVEGYNV